MRDAVALRADRGHHAAGPGRGEPLQERERGPVVARDRAVAQLRRLVDRHARRLRVGRQRLPAAGLGHRVQRGHPEPARGTGPGVCACSYPSSTSGRSASGPSQSERLPGERVPHEQQGPQRRRARGEGVDDVAVGLVGQQRRGVGRGEPAQLVGLVAGREAALAGAGRPELDDLVLGADHVAHRAQVPAEHGGEPRLLGQLAHGGVDPRLARVDLALGQAPVLVVRAVHDRDLDVVPGRRRRAPEDRPAAWTVIGSTPLALRLPGPSLPALPAAAAAGPGGRDTARPSWPSPAATGHGSQDPSGSRIQQRVDGAVAESRIEASCGGQARVGDGHERLDPAVEVAVHHVGAADPVLVGAHEVEDPRVLEEAPEDRAHPDVLREARHARPQRADARAR